MIYDKVALLLCCSISYISLSLSMTTVVPILIGITYASLLILIDNRIFKLIILGIFCVLIFIYKDLIFFLPLVYYDIFFSKYRLFIPVTFLISLIHFNQNELMQYSIIVCFILLSYIISLRTKQFTALQKQHTNYQDTSKETTLDLEFKNKELIERQDYDIHVATLTERNRIARDIHDHVGHMLSRSLLQVGALITITKDPVITPHLNSIQETLSTCMTCIRKSIHNLYDDSTSLSTEIQSIVDTFIFCPITLQYLIEDEVPDSIKLALIAIVKEGLSNIIRHSSATSVTLTLRAHPTFYQLIIHDNGVSSQTNTSSNMYDYANYGIGLKSIHTRVANLRGSFTIYTEDGFKLFITIPKEDY